MIWAEVIMAQILFHSADADSLSILQITFCDQRRLLEDLNRMSQRTK